MKKIAIIGAGNMGSAIARGMVRGGYCDAGEITVSNRTEGKLNALAAELPGLRTTTDNAAAAYGAALVILAVKPYTVASVADEIAPRFDPASQSLVSIAAGTDAARIAHCLGIDVSELSCFLAIPDTAISVGKGMTFICCKSSRYEDKDQVVRIFSTMGEVMTVDENMMEPVTLLSSCGIAYVYKFIQACVQAGVQLGIKPGDAMRAVLATVEGATAMLRHNGTQPQQEIDRVTTPGGMTIKGINELEHAGFTSAVIRGIMAPKKS